jgi:hypothetical protein
VNSYESEQFYLNVHELHVNIHRALFQILWFIPNLYKFIQICFEFIWKYAHCRTTAHYRTTRQPHTATRTTGNPHPAAYIAALLDTAVRSAAHTAAHCMNSNATHRNKKAYCTYTVAHRN